MEARQCGYIERSLPQVIRNLRLGWMIARAPLLAYMLPRDEPLYDPAWVPLFMTGFPSPCMACALLGAGWQVTPRRVGRHFRLLGRPTGACCGLTGGIGLG